MTPAVAALRRAGLSFRLHAAERSFGEEAARALVLLPERVFKTLVVRLAGDLMRLTAAIPAAIARAQ